MMDKFDKIMEEVTQQEIEECEKAVRKETMVALLLHGADKVRYGGLKGTEYVHGDKPISMDNGGNIPHT